MGLSIRNINIYKFLKFLSINLTSVFIPVFVYTTTKSIPLAFVYLVCSSIITISFNLIFKNIFSRHFIFSLILSFIVFIPSQLLIIFNNMNPYLYMIIMAFSQGVDKVLTNSLIDYLYNISPASEDAKNLKDTFLVGACATILSSIVGGVMLTYLHNAYTIGLAILISLISMIFILIKTRKTINMVKLNMLDKNTKSNIEKTQTILLEKNKTTNNLQDVDRQKFVVKNKKSVLVLTIFLMIILGIYLREQFTWGIYLNIKNINLTVIGIVNALIPVGQIMTNYLIYRFTLKNNENILLAISSVLIGACWILRIFLLDNFSIYFFTVMIGVLYPFLFQPIKYIYLHALKKYAKADSYLYLDECLRQVGCLICSLIGLIFSFLGITGMKVMFIISSVMIMMAPIIYMALNRKLKIHYKNDVKDENIVNSNITEEDVEADIDMKVNIESNEKFDEKIIDKNKGENYGSIKSMGLGKRKRSNMA